jgi:DNA-binding NarL/FixJ family response regulator
VDQSDIRVVVADERFLFRKGVRALLGQVAGIRVIEEASSPEGVLGAVETHAPDLLLLDSALSGSGLDLVKAVRRAHRTLACS